MGENDKLFLLIQSLTKNEKGYFKKLASFHTVGKANKYVLMFDLIKKQSVYDEQKIKKRLEKIILPKNYRESKRYLYEMILSSLEQYHSSFSTKTNLKKQIHRIEILYSKGLYNQCEQILNKTEVIAEQFEKWDVLIEINEWKSRLMAITSFEGKTLEDIALISSCEKRNINKLKLELEYQNLNLSFYYKLRKTRFARTKEEINVNYQPLINHPLLKNEQTANSIRAKLFFFGTMGSYYFSIQNLEKSEYYFTEHISIFEKHPELIIDHFGPYQSGLYNLITTKMRLGQFKNVPELIKKLEDLKSSNIHYVVRNFAFINLRKIELFNNTGQFEKAILLVPYIDSNIKKYNRQLNNAHRYLFEFNIGCSYLVLGKYKEALSRFRFIINREANSLLDLQSFARILSLLAHFEINENDQLPYVIRSTYRFLISKKRTFKFENILLKLINKVQNTNNEQDFKKMFNLFLKDIKLLQNDSFENKVFNYFDFISWAESKIENKPLVEIMKNKVLKPN